MSIPPLVCSTPPPPDQCEDDKDPEDFDLQYNLSQDDDENNDFDYGSFSTYNHFQNSISLSKKEEVPVITNVKNSQFENENKIEISEETTDNIEIVLKPNATSENETKYEEDINIEDLNLKVDQESLESNIKDDQEENETSKQNVNYSVEEKLSNNSPDDMNTCPSPTPSYEFTVEPNINNTEINNTEEPQPYVDEIIENEVEVMDINTSETNIVVKLSDDKEFPDLKECIDISEHVDSEHVDSEHIDSEHIDSEHIEIKNAEDDFGDFDDFNFVSSEKNIVAPIDNCDNPWRNDENLNSDFGDFKANFDENESSTQNSSTFTSQPSNESNDFESQVEQNDCDTDDFGDFDDFKSSAAEIKVNEIEESHSCQQVPVLNLQTPDNEIQVIESINKVLSCIFEQEISEPDSDFEGKLESLLCETWGHLMETDVRQPYIVNWNNSLGQKTLLRALCIDSRNILFGPKWSYNMPKYAANLSTAPLQPQKQSTPANIPQSEIVNPDKASSKAAGNWTDPFSSESHEFTYAEALLLDLEHLMATLDQMAHNHSTLKISELLSHACNTENENAVAQPRPTDLDVFEASISTKPDKIYSSTLNVQSLRQINLPDTHIFTPTDSETPRSKTIHYDCGPPMLIPQPVIENNNDQSEKLTSQDFGNVDENNFENDVEYSEFQDFKTSSDNTIESMNQKSLKNSVETAELKNTMQNTNVTYDTQILQPIKVEPIMPTLNWPNPGEVKETFDDFTDFVPNSSWNTEKQDMPSAQTCLENNKTVIVNDKLDPDIGDNEIKVNEEVTSKVGDTFDDEFDTFQSALPPSKNTPLELNSNFSHNTAISNHSQGILPQTATSITTNFDVAFPKIYNLKSDVISFSNVTPNESSTVNHTSLASLSLDNVSKPTEFKNSPLQSTGLQMADTNLLQPTPANPTAVMQNQQKTGQILQPLSLESFSQINWPNPGIDLQDLSRFNPVESLQSFKNDLSASSHSKVASPVHNQKSSTLNQVSDDDIWGDYVSSRPKPQQTVSKKQASFVDDDEWTDFVSNPSVKPQNGLNTISLNVHTNLNMQKSSNPSKFTMESNQIPLDIPTLNYITPKSTNHKTFNDRHFQNL